MSLGLLFIWPGMILAMPATFFNRYFFKKMRRSVRGSHQRYVAATIYITANGIEAIGLSLVATGIIIEGQVLGAAIFIFLTACCIICIAFALRDEDSWFNGRWNKLKQAIKKAYKAATSVRINVPRPVTA